MKVAHAVLQWPLFGNPLAHQRFLIRFLKMHPELHELTMDAATGGIMDAFFDICPGLFPADVEVEGLMPLDDVVIEHCLNLRKLRVGHAAADFEVLHTSSVNLLRACRHLEYFDAIQLRLDDDMQRLDIMRCGHPSLTFVAFEADLNIHALSSWPCSSFGSWPCLRHVRLTLFLGRQLLVLARFLFGLPMLQKISIVIDDFLIYDSPHDEPLCRDRWLSGLDAPQTLPPSLEKLHLEYDIVTDRDFEHARGIFRQLLGMHLTEAFHPKLKSVRARFNVRYCHALVGTDLSLSDFCGRESEVHAFLDRHRHVDRVYFECLCDTVRARHPGLNGHAGWVECGEAKAVFRISQCDGVREVTPSFERRSPRRLT